MKGGLPLGILLFYRMSTEFVSQGGNHFGAERFFLTGTETLKK
jgi:hypothetical protein